MKHKLKRTITISIMAIMVISSLAMSSYGTITDEDSASVSQMRKKAYRRMKDMSEVKWTIDKDITYAKTTTKSVTLKASNNGAKINYIGIPYSQIFRESSLTPNSPDYTIQSGTKNGRFSLKGVDCASAVAFAWRKANRSFSPNQYDDANYMKMTLKGSSTKNIYTVLAMLKDATCKQSTDFKTSSGYTYTTGIYVSLVGKYANDSAYTCKADYTSTLINMAVDLDNSVYAAILPGDAILRRVKDASNGTTISHIQMVKSIEIVKKGNVIDPTKSKVVCLDQYGTYAAEDEKHPNNISSWRHMEYTFEKLRQLNYIPIKTNKIDTV